MSLKKIIIGLFILGQASCSNDDFDINSFQDDPSITSLNGKWKVISFEDFVENKVEYKNQENSRGLGIIVTFDDTKNPNELSGTNTTNDVIGKFEYTGSRKFKVQNYSTTQVGQPAWADKFNQAILDGEVSLRINATGLRIYYYNKTKSVTLKKE